MTHWTRRLSRPTHCLRCGWKLSKDERRRYCSYGCFVVANRKWRRDRMRMLRALEPDKYRVVRRKRTAAGLVRDRLLKAAREEAKVRGLSVASVLKNWKADVGRVRA